MPRKIKLGAFHLDRGMVRGSIFVACVGVPASLMQWCGDWQPLPEDNLIMLMAMAATGKTL